MLLFAIAKIGKNCQPLRGFPLPEKKFSELHFFRQKWESFPYVKASHRGEAPPRGGGEGRNLFSTRIISIKGCNLLALPFLSPSGLTLPNCRSMQSRQVKWRAAPIEVYLNFRLMLRLPLASIKFCFTSSLPLGGKVDKAKLWTNEGRNLFSIRIISIKSCNLFVSPFLKQSPL